MKLFRTGCLSLTLCLAIPAYADVTLAPIFQAHMVLQRDVPLRVWGDANPGEQVTVALSGSGVNLEKPRSAAVAVDASGHWLATLPPAPAGGPYTLSVQGIQQITRDDILMGDVWLCGGQSNMEFGTGAVINAAQEMATAQYPQIRLFAVAHNIALAPTKKLSGAWWVCGPRAIGGFTAVGYFFGRELHQKLNIPIGLISNPWGGMPAEAFVSAGALATHPDFLPRIAEVQKLAQDPDLAAHADQRLEEWYLKNDPGSAQNYSFAATDLNDANWSSVDVPKSWDAAADSAVASFHGIAWTRRKVSIPDSFAGKDLVLHLSRIGDQDATFFNGTKVGAARGNTVKRDYKIPGGLVKPGDATIAIRIYGSARANGQLGPAPIVLASADATDKTPPIALEGQWKFKATAPVATLPKPPTLLQETPSTPTVLYNGMVYPLAPLCIKGVIWYQGESNEGRGAQYRWLLPALIASWRDTFETPDLPFYIVQLANYRAKDVLPVESHWAEIREAQMMTAQHVPHTGIALAIDVGDATTIHPKNKQAVGHRLALAALAQTYGQAIEFSGPVFSKMEVEGQKIRIHFTHSDGLRANDNKVTGFAIAGDDKKFVWADAAIDAADHSVVVSSEKIPHPAMVRYAWDNNPDASLYNSADLPAVPFRTDSPQP